MASLLEYVLSHSLQIFYLAVIFLHGLVCLFYSKGQYSAS